MPFEHHQYLKALMARFGGIRIADSRLAAFDAEGISICIVPFADPQTCFHNNRVTREKLTAPAWSCQVESKLKRFVGELGSTKR